MFITGFVGFSTGGVLNLIATDKLGFGKVSLYTHPCVLPRRHFYRALTQVIVIGSSCQIIGYALQFWRSPFPLFVISFFIIGFGTSWQDAQANSIVNRFDRPEMMMQILHAAYGEFLSSCVLQTGRVNSWVIIDLRHV